MYNWRGKMMLEVSRRKEIERKETERKEIERKERLRLAEIKRETQKAEQRRNTVVCDKKTNVEKGLPLDVNVNFRRLAFENSSCISDSESYIQTINQDFLVSKETSNYLVVKPSNEDCSINDVFDDKNSYDTALRGRWNRRLVLRHGEPEYYQPNNRNDGAMLESGNTGGDGNYSLYDFDVPNQDLNNNLDEAGLGIEIVPCKAKVVVRSSKIVKHYEENGFLIEDDETNSEAIKNFMKPLVRPDSEDFTPEKFKNVLKNNKESAEILESRVIKNYHQTDSKAGKSVSNIEYDLQEDLDDISQCGDSVLFKNETVLIHEADSSNHYDIDETEDCNLDVLHQELEEEVLHYESAEVLESREIKNYHQTDSENGKSVSSIEYDLHEDLDDILQCGDYVLFKNETVLTHEVASSNHSDIDEPEDCNLDVLHQAESQEAINKYQTDSETSSNMLCINEDEICLNGRGSRKRKANPLMWQQNRRKFKRNLGLKYTTKKGKVIPNKNCLRPINECCVYQCYKKFSPESFTKINTDYWALGTFTRKRDYIESHVKESLCARVKQGGSSKRKFSYQYFLPNDLNEDVKVCKSLFLTVLNISGTTVQTVKVKKRENLDVGFDYRGTVSDNRISDTLRQTVRDHIELFPVCESHYCRKDSKKLYLDSQLNQSKMYELYLDYMTKNHPDLFPVKASMYKKIFSTEYNMSFQIPKKDTCKYCEKFKMNPSEENLIEHTEHIKRKDLARKAKADDKTEAEANPSFKSFTFDLEAVLYAPCSNVSSFFYTRKFCTYNLTIFDQITKEGYCYVWNETNGGRGSDEIGSILFDFLKSLDPSVKHVAFFSDSCGGQNRNRFIASLLKYAVWVLPLETIEIKFLEVGHTQMEVDSMHSIIERAKKNKTIFSPLDWPLIIRGAKRTNPYKVTVLEFDQFHDLKKLKMEFIKGNLTSNQNKEKVNWMNIKCLRMEKSSPELIFYKNSYDEESFSTMHIGKKFVKTPTHHNHLKRKYLKELPVTMDKKKDLLKLCEDGIIPREYHSFYQNLPSTEQKKKMIDDSDFEEEPDI